MTSDITDIKCLLGLTYKDMLRYGKIVILCHDKIKNNIMYYLKEYYPSSKIIVE